MSAKNLLIMALIAMLAISSVDARKTHDDDVEPVDPFTPDDDIVDKEEEEESDDEEDKPAKDHWEQAQEVTTIIRSTWQGVIDGMYMGKADEVTLDDECFGDWMIEDTKQVTDFFGTLFSGHIFEIAYEDAMDASYDIVDLMFMNIEYCKFREVMFGWMVFFKTQEVFGPDFWKRVQGKAFDFISQVTALTETFSDLGKGETIQQKAQASYTISKGVTKIFVDFMGF